MKDNERIIQLVKAKLEWYTYKATAEEFDPGTVEALVKLLEFLDPLPEVSMIAADESFSRFMRKYKNCSYKREKHKWRLFRPLIACAAIILFLFIGINAGVYATSRIGFFEFISKSGSVWEFFITGEAETEYMSLDKMPGYVRDSIIIQDIPAGLDVEKIILLETKEGFHISMFCTADGKSLKISVDHPATVMPDAEYIGDIHGVSVYGLENAFWFSNRDCSYSVSSGMDEGVLFDLVSDLLR